MIKRDALAGRERLLSATFVELADTLVDDFDVIDVLTRLTERCVELLNAAASGILLVDQRGRLQVIATSSDEAQLLELFQLQNNEGPCLDCYRQGEAVVAPDLAQSNPWPRFGQVALDAGLPSVHAFPMRLRQRVVGTLNLFMREPTPLLDADIAVGQALAHAATIAILQEDATREARATVRQFRNALNSRVTIEQAKGVLSERAGITTDEAFNRLRATARRHREKLAALAAGIVERSLPEDLIDEITQSNATPEGDRA